MPSKYKTKAQAGLKRALTKSVKSARSTMLGTARVKPGEMRDALAIYFDKAKYDPIKELIATAKSEETPIKDRISIHKEFLRYLAPALKSIDIQQHVDANIQVVVRRFGEEIIEAELDEQSR